MKIGLLFNQPLGAQVAPIGNFAPKRIAPAVAAGLIAGGSALAAGVGNLVSQANTNDANKEINRENLAWQREQWKQQQENFKLQRKWQLEDASSERNWNSVQAQVGRYRAAGLNPALAMYGGAGQNQVSTGSVTPSAPSGSYSGQQMQMLPLNFEGLGIAGQTAANTYLAYERNENDMSVAKQHVQNETLDTMSKMIQRGFQNDHFKKQAQKIAQDIAFENENWSERSRAIKVANDKIHADQLYTEQLTEAQRFANEIAPHMNALEKKRLAGDIAQAAAAVAELESRSDLNSKEKELVGKKIVEQDVINKNLPKKQHNENAILVQTYNHVKAQAQHVKQVTETEKWHTLDAKKGYRQHIGSDRPLQDYVEDALRGKKLHSLGK